MRPLPIIVLIVASAAALVGGFLFLGRGDRGHGRDRHDLASTLGAAGPADPQRGGPSDPLADPRLDSSDADRGQDGRAASTLTAPGSEISPAVRPSGGEKPVTVLSGRVLGNLGRPVEGASVFAADAEAFPDLALDEPSPTAEGPGLTPEGNDSDRPPWLRRAEATTDREGRFQIRPEARSMVALSVRAPGFAPLDREFTLAGPERDLGDLSLDASVILGGRVVDASGRPVAGARIARLADAQAFLFSPEMPRGVTVAKTDQLGVFRVDQLAAGPWRLLVSHPAHPDRIETGETDRAGTVRNDLVITLEEGFEIRGRIVGSPADLLPKLSVRAVPQAEVEDAPPTDSDVPVFTPARQARCAADGSFTLSGLQRGRSYRLSAREGARGMFGRSRSASVNARAGDRDVELPYRAETALLFQVVDAESGAPIVDLSVQAGGSFPLPLLDDEGKLVRRFPEGRVRFGNLPVRGQSKQQALPQAGVAQAEGSVAAAGGTTLRVEAPGYEPYEREGIALLEGQDTDLGVLRLERAPVVSVLVLDDASGDPVPDALVTLTEWKPPASGSPGQSANERRLSFNVADEQGDLDAFVPGAAQRARTGADGRASVTSLPGKTARLRVQHAGYARTDSDPIALPARESVEQVVRLSVGGTVTVEVVDSHGEAISGAEIDHRSPEGDPSELILSSADGRTDSDGRLAFDHLQPGVHRFRLRPSAGGVVRLGGDRAFLRRVSRSGGEDESAWASIEVAERTAQTVRLVAPARGSLAGRITEVGKPLGNATLHLAPRDGDEVSMAFREGGREARTDGRGEYLFDGVEEGEYRLEVEHATRAMTYEGETRVREGENRLDLDLPLAIVEGTVTGEDGKPVTGARVRAERAPAPGGARRRAVAFAVMVRADGGEEPEVTMGSTIGAGPPTYTDASGRYSLRGVLPDVDLVVVAEEKDAQPARSANLHVAADETKRAVDLKLERGGAIEVTLVRAGGLPIGGYLVRAVPSEGERDPKIQMIGPGGSARLTGLKPGKWRVSLDPLAGGGGNESSADSKPADQEIEVQAGGTAKASFELPR